MHQQILAMIKTTELYFRPYLIKTDYSLFHQNLGVAFFQFAWSLFKFFQQNFFHIIFSSSPNIPENLVDFFRVLAELDHLACNKFSKLQLSLTPLPALA